MNDNSTKDRNKEKEPYLIASALTVGGVIKYY